MQSGIQGSQQMKGRRRPVLLVFLSVLALVGSFLCFKVWDVCEYAQRTAEVSTVRSLLSAIDTYLMTEPFEESTKILGSSAVWQTLSVDHYDELISHLSDRGSLIDRKGWKKGEILRDSWGSRYQVEVRMLSFTNQRYDIIVCSLGRDRRQKTGDDIREGGL